MEVEEPLSRFLLLAGKIFQERSSARTQSFTCSKVGVNCKNIIIYEKIKIKYTVIVVCDWVCSLTISQTVGYTEITSAGQSYF
jgi:hypothetical protein